MKPMVLDGSMTLGFLLPDEQSTHALKVKRALGNGRATHVPTLWWQETVNGLLMAERRRRVDARNVDIALDIFVSLPVITDAEPPSLTAASILDLARKYELSAYDAVYLELALRCKAALATNDAKLARAARSAGVELVN